MLRSRTGRSAAALTFIGLLWLTLAIAAAPGAEKPAPDHDRGIAFWDAQRRGANQQNSRFRPAWFEAAGELGLDFVRLIPDAWPAAGRDFLIGDADDFKQVNEQDLAVLRRALDAAGASGVKVVLTMASLPGARWRQLNDDRDDGRLWRDEEHQRRALAFWRQLAAQLRGHPAMVAYNPLNEPHPDREYGFEERDEKFDRWFDEIQGSVADLNRFNRRIVAAIREADSDTPIMLDGWFYAAPQAFDYNRPVDDDKVLYAFHNPGPWQMTAFRVNEGRYAYPDRVPKWWNGPTEAWTKERLAEEVGAVARFARRYDIPASRIVASEFWYDRRIEGAGRYLADLIDIYNDRGWHWAFYAYRGDGAWTGLDYELGADPVVVPGYWRAIEHGRDPETLKHRGDNPLWLVIKRQFQ